MEKAILVELMRNYIKKHGIKSLMELVLESITTVDDGVSSQGDR